MKLATRYLLRSYFQMLGLLTPVITGIYLLVEFFDKLDNVTNAGLPHTFLLCYLVLELPQILFETWPVVVSLSGLLALAFFARGGELLALRTLGFSPWRLARPYLVTAFLLSVVFIGVEELVLPESTYQGLYLWAVKVQKKKPRGLLLRGKLFFRGVNSFFVGKIINPSGHTLKEAVYTKVDAQGLPVFIIWAHEVVYQGRHRWLFEHGLYQKKATGFVPKWFDKYPLSLEFTPETVLVVKRIPRTQHLWELWKQRSFLKKAHLPTQVPDGEIAYRLFYPLAAPGLLALALPLLLGEKGRHALGRGLSLGLAAILGGLAAFLALKGLGETRHVPILLAQPLGLLALFSGGELLFYWRR